MNAAPAAAAARDPLYARCIVLLCLVGVFAAIAGGVSSSPARPARCRACP